MICPHSAMVRACLLVFAAVVARGGARASESPATAPIRIALAGDSTVATYPDNIAQKGWGQFLGLFFDDHVKVTNFAKGGRSTKTFLSEGLWAELLKSRPSIVLIQFGHNDSHSAENPEHTDPQGLYRSILERFIDETRAAGATPILVTPVQRRTATDNLIPYSDAMKGVASQRKVSLIDLHRSSGELYARLGPAGTAALAKSADDSTHFNAEGARLVAALVKDDLLICVPPLRGHLAHAPPAPAP